jgi:hypothetical protein
MKVGNIELRNPIKNFKLAKELLPKIVGDYGKALFQGKGRGPVIREVSPNMFKYPSGKLSTPKVMSGHERFIKRLPQTAPAEKTEAAPIATATPTPTPAFGRSKRALDIKKGSPERYEKANTVVNKLKPSEVEGNLLMDMWAQENALDEKGRAIGKDGKPVGTSRGAMMFNNATWKDYLDASSSARLNKHDRDNAQESLQAALYTIRKGLRGKGLQRWNASKFSWEPYYTPEELANFVK